MNAVNKLFAVCVLILGLFVVPLTITLHHHDQITQEYVSEATVKFIDNVMVQGKVTQGMWESYIKTLDATGDLYDIDFEYSKSITTPVQGATKVNYLNTQEVYYTEQIKQALYTSGTDGKLIDGNADGVLKMHTGDYVSIRVKSKYQSSASVLQSVFTKVISNLGAVEVSYGGQIRDQNYQEKSADVPDDLIITAAPATAKPTNKPSELRKISVNGGQVQKSLVAALGNGSNFKTLIVLDWDSYNAKGSKKIDAIGNQYHPNLMRLGQSIIYGDDLNKYSFGGTTTLADLYKPGQYSDRHLLNYTVTGDDFDSFEPAFTTSQKSNYICYDLTPSTQWDKYVCENADGDGTTLEYYRCTSKKPSAIGWDEVKKSLDDLNDPKHVVMTVVKASSSSKRYTVNVCSCMTTTDSSQYGQMFAGMVSRGEASGVTLGGKDIKDLCDPTKDNVKNPICHINPGNKKWTPSYNDYAGSTGWIKNEYDITYHEGQLHVVLFTLGL